MRRTALLVVLVFFAAIGLLLVFKIFNNSFLKNKDLHGVVPGDNKQKPATEVMSKATFVFESDDEKVSILLEKPDLLQQYADEFGVFQDQGLAIPIDTQGRGIATEVRWTRANRVIIRYTPSDQPNVLLESVNGPVLSFDANVSQDGIYYLTFSYSPLRKEIYDSELLNLRVSEAIYQLLYRVTHYWPRKPYNQEEIDEKVRRLEESGPFVKVEVQE